MWAVLTTETSKEVTHENLRCMKQSEPLFRMHEIFSHSGFWGAPAQHRDSLTCCKLCFTPICLFPIILIWRLSKAPAYSSVFFWILHMFLKRWLHRNTQMVTDHTICRGGEAMCGCCQPKQNAVSSLPLPKLSGINHVLCDSLQNPLEFSTLPCLPPNPVFLLKEAQTQGEDHSPSSPSRATITGQAGHPAPRAGTRSQVMQQKHTHWKPRMAPMYLVVENNSIPGRNWPLKVSQKGTATLEREGFGAKCHIRKKTSIHHSDSLLALAVWTDGCKKVKYAAEQHLSG